MKILIALSAAILACCASPIIIKNDLITITKDIFIEDYVVYSGEKEITDIIVPLNAINIDEHTSVTDFNFFVFFVEDGEGLYVLKDRLVHKVLENGKSVGASLMDGSKEVFLGASDGIYTFNAEKKTAEKYGTLTDNIRSILVANATHELYILTENNMFYQVTDDGTDKKRIMNVRDARQIALDNLNNLYYVDGKNNIYVRDFERGTVKKVSGLPVNPRYIRLLRPAPVLEVDVVPVFIDDKIYNVYSDGHAEDARVVLTGRASAISSEAARVVYLAHDNKIYELVYEDMQLVDRRIDLDVIKSRLNNQEKAVKNSHTRHH